MLKLLKQPFMINLNFMTQVVKSCGHVSQIISVTKHLTYRRDFGKQTPNLDNPVPSNKS